MNDTDIRFMCGVCCALAGMGCMVWATTTNNLHYMVSAIALMLCAMIGVKWNRQ